MPAPPRILERIVGLLTPPASREVVLGDVYQRYRSPLHYISDAWYAVPCVVYSCIRRTADAGVLLMDAMLVYASFLAAAWQLDRQLLYGKYGLVKLAVPSLLAVIALMLSDAYATPGKRSAFRPLMQGVLGIGLVCFAQSAFAAARFPFALPWWIVAAGGAAGVVSIAAIGMLFPKDDHRPRGAG
ncbi:MAG TPA: hypothetical protein VKS01_00965 [Bryobacteraceae bacterium]|nr:hypothetical protein [Bryobacteraceae bacterium]